jgi:Flp pilus assembly pilin Flp
MYSISGLSEGFMRFLHEEDGVSFIECALVLSLVAVVAAIGLLALGKGNFGWL